jgi:hypothetical protein
MKFILIALLLASSVAFTQTNDRLPPIEIIPMEGQPLYLSQSANSTMTLKAGSLLLIMQGTQRDDFHRMLQSSVTLLDKVAQNDVYTGASYDLFTFYDDNVRIRASLSAVKLPESAGYIRWYIYRGDTNRTVKLSSSNLKEMLEAVKKITDFSNTTNAKLDSLQRLILEAKLSF